MISKQITTVATAVAAIAILTVISGGGGAEAYTVDSALIQTVQGYAAETHHGNEHVDRWNRVLAAFGTIQHTDPMTAQEAQTYVDKGWNRWILVTAALVGIEKTATQQTEEPQSTDPQIDQTVIDTVTDWRDEQAAGTQHYERWDRVLAAFGTVNRTDAMTAQEAQTYVDKGWQRWVGIVGILEDIEAAAQQQQQDQQQQPQQQQGAALENPQYVPQQDQLPSTQQSQQQTDQEKLDVWKNRIIPPSDLEHIKWVDLDLYKRIVSMYPLAIHHIDDVQNEIDKGNTITSWTIPKANWILYISLTDDLKRLETTYEPCRPSNVECDFHVNTTGLIKNYTKTGDSFVVNQGTQWETTLTSITILIYDDQGNLESKEHKYHDSKSNSVNTYTMTTYWEMPNPDPFKPRIKEYRTYYAGGQTQMEETRSIENVITKHNEWAPNGRSVYEYSYIPGTFETLREAYYYDNSDNDVKSELIIQAGRLISDRCFDLDDNQYDRSLPNGMRDGRLVSNHSCTDFYYTKFLTLN